MEPILEKRKLLLIQNDIGSDRIRSLLENDFVVGAIESTRHAADHLKQDFNADFILADPMVLREDNFSLLRQLKNDPETNATPILVFAPEEEEEVCLKCIELGANDFILEPITATELKMRAQTQLRLAGSNRITPKPLSETGQMEALFHQAPVAIVLLQGPELVITFANPFFEKTFNRTATQLLGIPLWRVFPEVKRKSPGMFDTIYETGETGVRSGQEFIFDRAQNGVLEKLYFDLVARPIKDEDGVVTSIMVVAYETTPQVSAIEKLKASESEHRFLSTANKLLSSTLDHRKMLVSLAKMAVPQLSDYCFIDILSDDGYLERVAWAHKDPQLEKEFKNVVQIVPQVQASTHPVWRVLESEQPLIKQLDEKWMKEVAINEHHFNFMKKLNGRAMMVYPLIFRGLKLGTIALCKAGEGSAYTEEESRLAEELSTRVSMAVYKSKLYDQAQKEITIRKKLEKVLKKSEQRFRKLADTVPVMIWVSQPDGKFTYLNGQWRSYTGQPTKEGMGFGWLEAVHESERKLAAESFTTANARQVPFRYSIRLADKKGGYRWHLVSGVPRFSAGKEFEGFIGVILDIHERKLAEEKLSDRERKLSLSIEAGKVGIWEKDLVHHTTTSSRELKEIFGETEELGKSANGEKVFRNCTHPEDVPQVISYFKKIFRKQKKEFGLEFRITKPDGKVAWISERGRVEYDNGAPVKIYGTCIDISQQKLLEQQKDDFLSIASHELKTPVTSIKGHIQLLEESMREEGHGWGASQLKRVDVQIDKLVALINDLLDVTKIQAGKLEFNRQVFDFDKLVDEVLKNMKFLSTRHQLVKTGSSGRSVLADRNRIEQVLINLISNAIKYSPGASQIIINTSLKDDKVVLSVRDFGVGIPREQLARVFKRFYRVQNKKYSSTGLGLGLYIASEIIKGQEGSIWVESNPGEGSVFYFSLPLAAEELQEAGETSGKRQGGNSPKDSGKSRKTKNDA